MSNLPNSAIRLVPPTLRGGYCPDSWNEFARTVIGGTSAQPNLDRGTTFYNFGNQPVFPTPEPPEAACQDFLIDWEPAAYELGEVAFFSTADVPNLDGATSVSFDATTYTTPLSTGETWVIWGNTTLTTISWPNATTIANTLYIRANTALTTVNIPLAVTISPGPQIFGNTSLTTIDVSSWVPTNGQGIDFSGNALNQATVDLVLARAVANAGYVSGTVNLSGGTNATPSAQGLADKATLQARGCVVNTN